MRFYTLAALQLSQINFLYFSCMHSGWTIQKDLKETIDHFFSTNREELQIHYSRGGSRIQRQLGTGSGSRNRCLENVLALFFFIIGLWRDNLLCVHQWIPSRFVFQHGSVPGAHEGHRPDAGHGGHGLHPLLDPDPHFRGAPGLLCHWRPGVWGGEAHEDCVQPAGLRQQVSSIHIIDILENACFTFYSCINPLIYGFMSKNFRRSFSEALCKCSINVRGKETGCNSNEKR